LHESELTKDRTLQPKNDLAGFILFDTGGSL
jgi:hypothetical protein